MTLGPLCSLSVSPAASLRLLPVPSLPTWTHFPKWHLPSCPSLSQILLPTLQDMLKCLLSKHPNVGNTLNTLFCPRVPSGAGWGDSETPMASGHESWGKGYNPRSRGTCEGVTWWVPGWPSGVKTQKPWATGWVFHQEGGVLILISQWQFCLSTLHAKLLSEYLEIGQMSELIYLPLILVTLSLFSRNTTWNVYHSVHKCRVSYQNWQRN